MEKWCNMCNNLSEGGPHVKNKNIWLIFITVMWVIGELFRNCNTTFDRAPVVRILG